MKRFLLTVVLLGLATGAARADWGGTSPAPAPQQGGAGAPQLGGPNTLVGMGGPANGMAPDTHGLHPRLKRIFGLGSSSQKGYGQMGPAYNPNAYAPAQGTLVFPNHPFVRSPRDYFMLDLNK